MHSISTSSIRIFFLAVFIGVAVLVGLSGHHDKAPVAASERPTDLSMAAYRLPAPPAVIRKAPQPVSKTISRPPTKLPVSPPLGSVAARIAAVWPGDDVWALATVRCESSFNPYEVGGDSNSYFGLFQMGPWARARYGNPLNQTVEQQTLSAWRLLKDEGSGQWTCSPWSYHP